MLKGIAQKDRVVILIQVFIPLVYRVLSIIQVVIPTQSKELVRGPPELVQHFRL
jgi:hypothetical protein